MAKRSGSPNFKDSGAVDEVDGVEVNLQIQVDLALPLAKLLL